MTYKEVLDLAEKKGYDYYELLNAYLPEELEVCNIQKWLWEKHWLWVWVTMDCTVNEITGFDYHIHRALAFPVLRINGEPELDAEMALLKGIHHALTLI